MEDACPDCGLPHPASNPYCFCRKTHFTPEMVTVPRIDLVHLCDLAEEAGLDLQLAAEAEYQGDHPDTVRRRKRDLEYAQTIIDAAAVMRRCISG